MSAHAPARPTNAATVQGPMPVTSYPAHRHSRQPRASNCPRCRTITARTAMTIDHAATREAGRKLTDGAYGTVLGWPHLTHTRVHGGLRWSDSHRGPPNDPQP